MIKSAHEHAEEIAGAIVDYVSALDTRYADRATVQEIAYKALVENIAAGLIAAAFIGATRAPPDGRRVE